MTSIPATLLWCLSAGTAAAVVMTFFLVRMRRGSQALRRHLATAEARRSAAERGHSELAAQLRATEDELRHLAEARLPDLATSLAHPHVAVRGLRDPRFTATDVDRSLTSAMDQLAQAVAKERARVDEAAQATMRGATTTIQALLYRLQTLLQEMQHRYDDQAVAQDLLQADFLNEQALRRVQTTGVVCGAWPGLTRDDSHLADLVVGAMSRLRGYERIQVSNLLRDPVGVVARAVEPVAIALTELLANALHHSHHELPVAVTLQQGNRGASVIVDDYGIGMHADEIAYATRLLGGGEQVLLTELGDPPRSGFAAVGQLVRQYGFTVHVESSPYGGVRAVVYIPGDPLLTLMDETAQPMSAMAPLPPQMLHAHSTPLGVPQTMSQGMSHAVSQTASQVDPAPGSAPVAAAEHTPARAPEAEPVRTPEPTPARAPEAETAYTPEAEREAEPWHEAEPAHAPDSASDAGLPRRRRRRPAVEPERPLPRTEPVAERSPQESATRWAALQSGTLSGRAEAEYRIPRPEGNDQG
ncbi:ATP-binding protein [Streptomyces ochraceiscleroticus]|uniref:histidine kinase n=1 Tax=Streptomyces ochraceiscleroticus TaxID=47761 RepID=A0ABW1MWT7_9ACTN|nr:ATP-binding protein [Streptomyces ochraceiscleroticus]